MKCPVCKMSELAAHEASPDFVSLKCRDCGGQWISCYEYWRWFQANPGPPKGAAVEPLPMTTHETGTARLCPECGHVLARFKVGHALDFTLDRCGECGGTWFDRNEWEILTSGPLHDRIHYIFTAAWQKQVRNEDRVRHLQRLFAQKIGEKDYVEIRRIKEWLTIHPHRRELCAFLLTDEF